MPSIAGGSEVLWRRVMPEQRNPDGSAQSAAFRTGGLCVHRAALTNIAAVIAAYPTAHLYEFTVQEALAAGASDVVDDLVAGDPADHAMVLGMTTSGKAKRLKGVARRVHPP